MSTDLHDKTLALLAQLGEHAGPLGPTPRTATVNLPAELLVQARELRRALLKKEKPDGQVK